MHRNIDLSAHTSAAMINPSRARWSAGSSDVRMTTTSTSIAGMRYDAPMSCGACSFRRAVITHSEPGNRLAVRGTDRAPPWLGSRLETLRASGLSCTLPKHKDELSAWLAGSTSFERHHLGFASRTPPLQRAPTFSPRRFRLGKIGCAYVARNDIHRFEPFTKSIENIGHSTASKEMSMTHVLAKTKFDHLTRLSMTCEHFSEKPA